MVIIEGSQRKTNIQPCPVQNVFLQQSLENNCTCISHNTLHVLTCTIKCICLFLLYFDTKNIKGFILYTKILIKTNKERIMALHWPCNWKSSPAIAKTQISLPRKMPFYMFHRNVRSIKKHAQWKRYPTPLICWHFLIS